MNKDTEREVENIKARGWYLPSQGLGEGGWPAVHKFAGDWKRYELRFGYDDTFVVIAKDDETARAHAHKFYNLDGITYDLVQVETTYRLIESSD